MHPQAIALTDAELDSASAIRATLTKSGHLKDADAFRAANAASREAHGDDRHEAVKWHALHSRAV